MQADPVMEWQRLAAHYRQMSDDELRELAFDFADLTDTAQQVLRSEMRSRGLGDPERARSAPEPQPAPKEPSQAPLPLRNAPWAGDPVGIAFGAPFAARAPELVPDAPGTNNKADGPHEYTWKTLLCECETSEQAWQLSEALKRAGIESWIEGATRYSPYSEFDTTGPRVLVAADQLDQARLITAQPVPREICEASETKVPSFTPPNCPGCGAEDPVLEAVDPENTWRCEQCGAEWTETLPDPGAEA